MSEINPLSQAPEITPIQQPQVVDAAVMDAEAISTLVPAEGEGNIAIPEVEELQTEVVEEELVIEPKKTLIQRLSEIGTVSKKEVVEFTRHLAVMIGAGVTIFEAVKFLQEQTKNKVFNARLKSVLSNLNNGKTLSESMRKFPKIFPEIYTNIVAVGEQSGSLHKTMVSLADQLEEAEKFKAKIKGAMIYPKIIGTVMLTFMLILVMFVMPRILNIFNSMGAEIPLSTRIVIKVTEFINGHIFMIAIAALGAGFGVFLLLKNSRIKRALERIYLKTPFIGRIVLNYNAAQVSQYFSGLISNGITIVKTLEITKTVIANHTFQEEVEHMATKIKNGASLSQSFKKDTKFPPMFSKMIMVGERTGKLPHVMEYLKTYYKGLVDTDVKNISTIIEPAIMVLMGLMVAGLVVVVIGPIYQLISDVGA